MRQKGDDEDEFEMRSGASNKPDGSSGAGSCRASSFVSRLGCRKRDFFRGSLGTEQLYSLFLFCARVRTT